MVWKECVILVFCKDICSQENFLYLNGKIAVYPKVAQIINDFLAMDEKIYLQLRNSLSQFKNIFQYVYSNVYPGIYCSTKRRGFALKGTFHVVFKVYRDKKKAEKFGKNVQNYVNKHAEICASEQSPIEIDDYNEEEEKEIKKWVKKGKQKRRQVAKKKGLKKMKAQDDKTNEKEMWDWLKELNTKKNLKKVKNHLKINCT